MKKLAPPKNGPPEQIFQKYLDPWNKYFRKGLIYKDPFKIFRPTPNPQNMDPLEIFGPTQNMDPTKTLGLKISKLLFFKEILLLIIEQVQHNKYLYTIQSL